MANLSNLVQKAFYLGVGLANYASEKAGETLAELRVQAQKLADEMVERGELSTEEARRMVDEMVARAQRPPDVVEAKPTTDEPREPRRIEIIEEDEEPGAGAKPGEATRDPNPEPDEVTRMREQVSALEAELQRLRDRR